MEFLHVGADDGNAIIRQVVDCGEVISDVVSRHEEDAQRGGIGIHNTFLHIHSIGIIVCPGGHIRTHSMDGGVDLTRLRIDADDVLRITLQRIEVGTARRNGVVGKRPDLCVIAEVAAGEALQQFSLPGEELDAIVDQAHIKASVPVVGIRRIGDGGGIGAGRERNGFLHLA